MIHGNGFMKIDFCWNLSHHSPGTGLVHQFDKRQKTSNWCANPVLTYKIASLSLQVKGQQVKSGLRSLRSTIFLRAAKAKEFVMSLLKYLMNLEYNRDQGNKKQTPTLIQKNLHLLIYSFFFIWEALIMRRICGDLPIIWFAFVHLANIFAIYVMRFPQCVIKHAECWYQIIWIK